MTFTSTNFLASNFTLDLALPAGLTGTLVETATSIDLDVTARSTTGPLIQISGPVVTPTRTVPRHRPGHDGHSDGEQHDLVR